MRWIILLALLALVACGLGWFYVRTTDERLEIIIDKEEVRTDTKEVIERGREWLDEVDEEADEEADGETEESVQDSEAGVPTGGDRPDSENAPSPKPEHEGVNS